MEDRGVYGVENSSMFLECSPKSQRALIYWQQQKPNDDRKHEVRTACTLPRVGLSSSREWKNGQLPLWPSASLT